LIYAGDLVGNLYAVDAISGRLVWSLRADSHPSTVLTGTPVLYGSGLYVPVSSLEEGTNDPKYQCCTFRGNVVAYDAKTGKEVWRTYTVDVPKQVGVTPAGTK
jgi:polyvinyl alcohol dehydrogenase (cytochrome)